MEYALLCSLMAQERACALEWVACNPEICPVFNFSEKDGYGLLELNLPFLSFFLSFLGLACVRILGSGRFFGSSRGIADFCYLWMFVVVFVVVEQPLWLSTTSRIPKTGFLAGGERGGGENVS